jgi:hypothetical protein
VIQHPAVIRMGQADDSLWRIWLFTSTPARLMFNVHQFMRSGAWGRINRENPLTAELTHSHDF